MILINITLKCDDCGALASAQIEGIPCPDALTVRAPPGWSETHTRRRNMINLGEPSALCPECLQRRRTTPP